MHHLDYSKQTAYITKGLPGSGKTTWAENKVTELSKEGRICVRINNDDIREELAGPNHKWTPEFEKSVAKEREMKIKYSLYEGYDIILDNTYLNEKTFKKMVLYLETLFPKIKIVIQDFTDVPVITCIERDAEREKKGKRFVGSKVILDMARSAKLELYPDFRKIDPNLPYAIICDLDGSLARFGFRRNPYDASQCLETDEPHKGIQSVLLQFLFNSPNKIFFFSGRTDKYMPQTFQWLDKIGFVVKNDFKMELVMRKDGDKRPDTEVKKEMFDTYIDGKYNVLFIFDDRPIVIRMWKSLGLPVFNVGDCVEF